MKMFILIIFVYITSTGQYSIKIHILDSQNFIKFLLYTILNFTDFSNSLFLNFDKNAILKTN